ncbi:hypothetical protein BDZ45DRAFT_171207 [Acephala macrosclerotiorum]|nr:hypothetical protein BDZ45DRAFT_171207 [Acephala macrosclerotiorum]
MLAISLLLLRLPGCLLAFPPSRVLTAIDLPQMCRWISDAPWDSHLSERLVLNRKHSRWLRAGWDHVDQGSTPARSLSRAGSNLIDTNENEEHRLRATSHRPSELSNDCAKKKLISPSGQMKYARAYCQIQ